MAHDDDFLDDEDSIDTESDNDDSDLKINIDRIKIDARRRLEEYMEMKKLREQLEF